MTTTLDPSKTSSAYDRMSPTWGMIDDILAGPDAIRAAKIKYLSKHEAEEPEEYNRRVKEAPWQPEFEDILRSLASKPFGKEVGLGDKASDPIKAFAEDVDSRGNNLTAFARGVFEGGVAKGQHLILVDHSGSGTARTLAEEKQSGARPYWVSICADDVLALYTAFVGGKEVPIHIRLREDTIERVGFGEKTTKRVRVLDRAPIETAGKVTGYGLPIWTLWEEVEDPETKGKVWIIADDGAYVPLTEIPAVVFRTGKREGSHYVKPPLSALADKQIELYRALARQDDIMTKAAFPMLTANGMGAPTGPGAKLVVGPSRILYAPGAQGIQTSWDYIQPDAALITEIREGVKTTEEALRRLGMQPMTMRSGTVSATESAIEGAKAHSTVEAWALGFQDALEQAFVFTSQWLAEEPTTEVTVDTDFSVEPYAQAPLDALNKARASGDLSQRTYWGGMRRFDVLPPDFDADAEEKALAEEQQGLEPEVPIDPITGLPIADPAANAA